MKLLEFQNRINLDRANLNDVDNIDGLGEGFVRIVKTVGDHQVAFVTTGLDEIVLTMDTNPPTDANIVQVANNQDLIVFADRVVVRGPLSIPGRTVSIFARSVDTAPDTAGAAASINVSGASQPPPPAQLPVDPTPSKNENAHCSLAGDGREAVPGSNGTGGSPGANGLPGGNAGAIAIFAESLPVAGPLALEANGGNGQDGQDGQPGENGGDGGDGCYEYGSTYIGDDSHNGAPGGQGGNGSTGGNAGAGGSAGNIDVSFVNGSPASLAITITVGQPGKPGKAGAPGTPGNGGAGTFDNDGNPTSQPGATGPAGAVASDGAVAAPGAPGASSATTVDYAALSPNVSAAQCQMLLLRVRLQYLSLDPSAQDSSAYVKLALDLVWIERITAYFDAQSPNPLPPGMTQDEFTQLQHSHKLAASLLLQLLQHRDYYGHTFSFVPRGSFNFYSGRLNTLIADFQTVAATFSSYFTNLASAEQTAQLNNAQQQANKIRLTQLASDLADAIAAAQSAKTRIESDTVAVANQRTVLLAALGSVAQQLANIAGAECVIENLLTAIGTVASIAGEDDMKAAKQFAEGIKGAKELGSTLGDGIFEGPGELFNAVQKVDLLRDSVATIKEGFVANGGTLITSTDPHGYKIIAVQSDLDEELAPFRALPAAQSALEAMDSYVALSLQLSGDVMAFNVAVLKRARVEAAQAQLTAQISQVSQELAAGSNPALPQLVLFVSHLYQDMKAMLLYELYLANRAMAFWSLDLSYSTFFSSFNLASLGDANQALLAQQQAALVSGFQTIVESRGADPQRFPAADQDAGEGITAKLTSPMLLEALRTSNRVDFQISAAFKTAAGDAPNPFADMFDVRLTKVRAYVRGAKTSDNLLKLKLSHGTRETIVKTDGTTPVVFDHADTPLLFVYNLENESDRRTDGEFVFQGPGISPDDSKFALLGPFTTWTLEVLPGDNDGLDLSAITDILLDFHGVFFTSNAVIPAAASAAAAVAGDANPA